MTRAHAGEAGSTRRGQPGCWHPAWAAGAGGPYGGAQRPQPTRRQVLAGSLAAMLTVSPLVVGCTAPAEPPPPDPLEPLVAAALADAELADSVAAAHPPLAPAARALAADRRAHATAVEAEVRRATPSPVTSTAAVTTTTVVPSDRAAASGALVAATKAAQAQAGGLVASLPRHRVALVASVAACCASHLAVLG